MHQEPSAANTWPGIGSAPPPTPQNTGVGPPGPEGFPPLSENRTPHRLTPGIATLP